MTTSHRIGFIGVGAMGKSILAGLIQSEQFSPDDISIVSKSEARADWVSQQFNVQRHSCIDTLAQSCDVILLCVKPKDLSVVAGKMERVDLSGKLLISTLAGVSMKSLRDKFPEPFLVRSIPNIASEVGEGVTLWSASEETPRSYLELTQRLWGAVGLSLQVDHEDYITLGSPISGAAPAFMGLFMEALVDAGVLLGLPRDMSSQLVLQSLKGSCELISHAERDACLVRHRVTSPGGLTAVCMAKLETEGFRKALLESVVAGNLKTVELGRS